MNAELITRSNAWANKVGPGWVADTSPGSEQADALYIIHGRVSLRKIEGKMFKWKYADGVLISATIDKKCCSMGNTYQEALEGLLNNLYHHPEIAYAGLDKDVAAITKAIETYC